MFVYPPTIVFVTGDEKDTVKISGTTIIGLMLMLNLHSAKMIE